MPHKSINEYIQTFDAEIQKILQNIRKNIQSAAPEAISYQIPIFKLNGKKLVHFAVYKKHIGFYPTPHGMAAFDA